MKKATKTKKAPAATGLLSQAIEKDGLVLTSGQIHLTPAGDLVKGSMIEKTKQVMSNLEAILEAAGLGFENVLKTTVYVTDMVWRNTESLTKYMLLILRNHFLLVK